MGRNSRNNATVAIQSIGKTTDGFGGRVNATPVTVVAAYSMLWWEVSAYSRQRRIADYGLSDDASLIEAAGEYEPLIEPGLVFSLNDCNWTIVGRSHNRGKGIAPISTSIVAEKRRK